MWLMAKLIRMINTTVQIPLVHFFHQFYNSVATIIKDPQEQHYPTKHMLDKQQSSIFTGAIHKPSLRKAFTQKLIPYASAIYNLYAEKPKNKCINLFWVLADYFQEQIKNRVNLDQYKQLITYNNSLDSYANGMSFYKEVNKVDISLNTLARALQYTYLLSV